jgi:hypothetical protein
MKSKLTSKAGGGANNARKKKDVVELYINLVDNNEKVASKHTRSKGKKHCKNKSFVSETVDIKNNKPTKISLNLSSNFKTSN